MSYKNRLGFQAPVGRRETKGFSRIEVKDMHYCASHDFWFNTEEQKELLHKGLPCFHTDKRYVKGKYNFYGEGSMVWNRKKGFSIKACIRRVKKTRNLPLGTIVNIANKCYGVFKNKKSFSLAYKFKVRKENIFDPAYEVNKGGYVANFTTDDKARDLTTLLRANGFIVNVHTDDDYLPPDFKQTKQYELALAYGHGLKIGYSANDSSLYGYHYGVKSVLYDKWDEFDKWSRCNGLDKTLSNEEILNELLTYSKENLEVSE